MEHASSQQRHPKIFIYLPTLGQLGRAKVPQDLDLGLTLL
jgi:hypothetical protein